MSNNEKQRKRDRLQDLISLGHSRKNDTSASPPPTSQTESNNHNPASDASTSETRSATDDTGSLDSSARTSRPNSDVLDRPRKESSTAPSSTSFRTNSNKPVSTSLPSARKASTYAPTEPPKSLSPSSAPAPSPEESETFFEKYPNLKHFLKHTVVNGLAIAADASSIPGVKAAATAIQALVKFAEKVKEHREKVEGLANEAASYTDGLLQIPEPTGSLRTDVNAVFKQLVKELMDELAKATETMNKITNENTSLPAESWKQGDIGDKINPRTGALQKAREKFTTLTVALNNVNSQLILADTQHVRINNQHILQMMNDVLEILRRQEHVKFDWDTPRLPYITAAYDQDSTVRICHNETRAAILKDLYTQLSSVSDQDSRIIWLRALAGSGKSTIAKTVAAYLKQKGCLAGSFFFSRNISDRSGMANVFATLANQLAAHHEEFAVKLLEAIAADRQLQYAEPMKQLEELLIKPLNAMSSSKPFIFVIDALDECGKDQGNSFLRLLLPYIRHFPPSFRFFVTSRPEAPIINQLSSSDDLPIQTINIDEKGYEVTSRQDIYTFILVELRKVKGLNVTDGEILALAKLADGLFQFVATAVLMITDSQYQTPRETLDSILNLKGNDNANLSQRVALDNLYETIFKQAYPHRELVPRHQVKSYNEMIRRYHLAVGGIVRAQEPLSMRMLAALVGLPMDQVKSALERLSSVLLLPNNLDTPIRIRHLTFTEYVTDSDSQGTLYQYNAELVIDNRTHGVIAEKALLIAAKQLRFNISEFESSFVPNSAESLARAEKAIPGDLAYACRFWGYHLEHMPQDAVLDLSPVRTFMEEKLLFWFEALSALGAVNVARAALVSLDRRLKSTVPNKNVSLADIKSLVKDAIKFIAYFAPVIVESPPHTYLSTLLFSPTSSAVAQHYLPLFKDIPVLEIGQLTSWPPRELVFHGHSGRVASVAVSPDGKHVVSGSHDSTIRIWNAETGQTVAGPFEGHSSPVLSVAWSPDGKHVVSGSWDSTIRMWDAETGQTVAGPFQGHSSSVTSVAWSPDGKHVVSGSSDNTIRMWDAETGQTVAGPFEDHSYSISSAAWSPDGKHVVSGSHDNTIRIIDPHSSSCWASFEDRVVIGTDGWDGWVKGPDSELLLWVPPLHRFCFHRPHNVRVMGPNETRVNCSQVVWGKQWTNIAMPELLR